MAVERKAASVGSVVELPVAQKMERSKCKSEDKTAYMLKCKKNDLKMAQMRHNLRETDQRIHHRAIGDDSSLQSEIFQKFSCFERISQHSF